MKDGGNLIVFSLLPTGIVESGEKIPSGVFDTSAKFSTAVVGTSVLPPLMCL
jgi:hypothetical protein